MGRRGILGQILSDPVRVLLDRFGHDDDFVAGRAVKGWDVLHGAMLEGVFPCVGDVGGDAILVPYVFELYLYDEEEDDEEDGGTQGEAQGQPHCCGSGTAA